MTFSIAQFVAVLILGCSSFLSGWMLRRIHAKSREAQLQKVLVEAQTTIPPLETNIRNRDQRIASLFAELTEWKTKVPTLEASTKRKDVELLAKDRELKTARVEIDALKATVAATSAIDPTKMAELESIRESLRASQERCVTLTAEVAERDVRLADARSAVPAFIALPVAPATQTEADLLARADLLASDIAVRDQHIAALQTRLNAEVDLREIDVHHGVRCWRSGLELGCSSPSKTAIGHQLTPDHKPGIGPGIGMIRKTVVESRDQQPSFGLAPSPA